MEVDIKNYLTNEELKDIAREAAMANFSAQLKTEEDTRRILSNVSYDIVYKMVDSTINENLDEMLSNKVADIVSSMTTFNVFKEPDAWSRNSNSMYKILERELLARKDELADVVVKSLQQAPKQYVRAIGQEAFTKIVSDAMKKR